MISFEAHIRTNYTAACEKLRTFLKDDEMKAMLASGGQDISLVKSWMRDYGLFQGISTDDRDKTAKRFLSFSTSVGPMPTVIDKKFIEGKYSELFEALFDEVKRTWISATSKLLWCIYPNEVVLYDSFVWQTLVVMQWLDSELASFPRIGVAPSVAPGSEIALAVRHYMNYQDMVRYISERNSGTLNELRAKHQELYPHDIRIIDQLLWMVGKPE